MFHILYLVPRRVLTRVSLLAGIDSDSDRSSSVRVPVQSHRPPNYDTYKQASISRGTLHLQQQKQQQYSQKGQVQSNHRRLENPDALSALPKIKSVAFDTRDTYEKDRKMASMLNSDRARSRRERTFVGGECAACEELLEHTLRGERVLQFSCGHVAHEACFYEYIKDSDCQYCPTCDAPLGLDSSRGGSILDLGTCVAGSLKCLLT